MFGSKESSDILPLEFKEADAVSLPDGTAGLPMLPESGNRVQEDRITISNTVIVMILLCRRGKYFVLLK